MSKANHNKLAILLLNVFSMLIFSGCISKTHQIEQSSIRETILKLTEEQIVDNLIRYKEGYPMIHIKYTTIEGTVTLDHSGEINSSRTEASSVINDAFSFSLSSKQTDALKLVAVPIYNNSAIYDLYKNAAEKLVDINIPKDCNEYDAIRRRFKGKNYYILLQSKEQKKAFGELCYNILNADEKKTTDKALIVSDVINGGTITDANGDVVKTKIIVEFNQEVLNDISEITVKISSKKYNLYPLSEIAIKTLTKKLVMFENNDSDNFNNIKTILKGNEITIDTSFIKITEKGVLEETLERLKNIDENLKIIRLKD